MDVLFVASVAVIAADPPTSRELYVDAIGLPLRQTFGEYYSSEEIGGVNHFGVWPLEHAAQSCFGSPEWPADVPVPQASIEFELRDAAAVQAGAEELVGHGYQLLHEAQLEPWGQTVARLLGPEGSIVGLSFAPWMHE